MVGPRRAAELRALTVLALPLVFAQLAQNGMGFIDAVMVGRLGPDALAAIALGNTLFFLVLIGMSSVLAAVGPFVAQAYGAKRPEDAARATRQGIWLALFLSVPAVLLVASGERLLVAFGQDPTTAAAAGTYLRGMALGLPAVLVFTPLRGFLEGHGNTRPILIVSVVGVLVNVVGNDALMFGHLGLPRLGLVGTAYASAFAYLVMATLLALVVAVRYQPYRVFRGMRRPDPGMLLELLRVGWPIGLTASFEAGLFAVTALLMGHYGTAALAGHMIAVQSASTTFMVPLGISIAASVRVGQAAGRDDRAAVRMAASTGVAVCGAVMACSAVVFWLLPGVIIRLYLGADLDAAGATVLFATRFLAVAALFQVADGLQVAAVGALRGLKDTRVPMLLTLVAYWLVGVPIGVALSFGLSLGPVGLWLGLLCGLACAATLLLFRLRRAVGWARPRPGRSDLAMR